MNKNSTKPSDLRLSNLFIKECRKFILALESDCSVQELADMRQRIIQIRVQQNLDKTKSSLFA